MMIFMARNPHPWQTVIQVPRCLRNIESARRRIIELAPALCPPGTSR
jgi:hypothetical protein